MLITFGPSTVPNASRPSRNQNLVNSINRICYSVDLHLAPTTPTSITMSTHADADLPDENVFNKLAKALGCSEHALIFVIEPPEPQSDDGESEGGDGLPLTVRAGPTFLALARARSENSELDEARLAGEEPFITSSSSWR